MTDCVVHLDEFVIDPEYTIQPRAAPCILGAYCHVAPLGRPTKALCSYVIT